MKSETKSRPIPFSAPMVRALLDGTKTQTRRIIKPQPGDHESDEGYGAMHRSPWVEGDRAYVKETWRAKKCYDHLPPREIWSGSPIDYTADDERTNFGKVRSPLHLPRWASRITLELTGVRVERLTSISEEDAKAEGCAKEFEGNIGDGPCPTCDGKGVHAALGAGLGITEVSCGDCATAKMRYSHLWNKINGPGSWNLDPYVWILSFRRITP